MPSSLQALEVLPDVLRDLHDWVSGVPCCRARGALEAAYSQRLDGLQRGKEPLADGLQLVVVQGEQVEVLQVLERVHPQAVDLVGVEEAASRREAGDPPTLGSTRGPRAAPAGHGHRAPGALLLGLGVCC